MLIRSTLPACYERFAVSRPSQTLAGTRVHVLHNEEAHQALLQDSGGFFAVGTTRIRPFMTAILLAVTFLGTVLVLSPLSSALAASHSSVAGNVYVLNNPAGPNSISVFNRAANGKLTFAGMTEIGGRGSGTGRSGHHPALQPRRAEQ